MENRLSCVYVMDCDEPLTSAIMINALIKQLPVDKAESIIIIGCIRDGLYHDERVENFHNLTEYLIHLYRQLSLHNNIRETVFSTEDQLVAMQLCMAGYNREKHDMFDVQASEVLTASNQLIQDYLTEHNDSHSSKEISEYNAVASSYKDFLLSCNCTDFAKALHEVKHLFSTSSEVVTRYNSNYVLLQWPQNQVEATFLALLCQNNSHYTHVTAEVPVAIDTSELHLKDILIRCHDVAIPSCEDMISKSLSNTHSLTPSLTKRNDAATLSTTETHVKRVFLSYLTLVVNTRDELALARCFNVPDRKLDHEAFTTLKREARQKNMTMCQTATSYVMRIRLGGKGYAPDESSPIAQHVRGLSEFVNLIQKIQMIVEEDHVPSSALTRVVSQIKITLFKSKDPTFRRESIENVSDCLNVLIGKLGERKNRKSPPRSIGNGGSMAGRKTIKLLRRFLDQEASRHSTSRSVNVLCDGFTSQKTPIRIPSLLSLFRSPAISSPESPENQTLLDRVLHKENNKKNMSRTGYRSCMMWADPKETEEENQRNEECLSIINNDDNPVVNNKDTFRKNTVCVTSENVSHRQIINGEISNHGDTILEMIDQDNQSLVLKLQADVDKSAVETPKRRGGMKRQPFRDMNQNPVKKAKTNIKQTSKKKKNIPQIKGQKTLSNFFRM